MSAEGCAFAALSNRSSASGAGALSSWRSQTHSTPEPVADPADSTESASQTAPPYDERAGATSTDSGPSRSRSSRGLSSELSVSRATTRSGGRVCAASASSTAGSHREPSWLTRTAVTAAPSCVCPRVVTADHPRRPRQPSVVRRTQTARFLSLRRSRSESPPQMPNRSSWPSAYSKHSSRTSHVRHTRLASLVEPPFSGKNASGSVCAHRARSCQPSSAASPSSRYNSRTAFALSTRETLTGPVLDAFLGGLSLTVVASHATRPRNAELERHCWNYTSVAPAKSSPDLI